MATASDWNTNRVEVICDRIILQVAQQMHRDGMITLEQLNYVANTYVCVVKDTNMAPNIGERILRMFNLTQPKEKTETSYMFGVAKVDDIGAPRAATPVPATLTQTTRSRRNRTQVPVNSKMEL